MFRSSVLPSTAHFYFRFVLFSVMLYPFRPYHLLTIFKAYLCFSLKWTARRKIRRAQRFFENDFDKAIPVFFWTMPSNTVKKSSTGGTKSRIEEPFSDVYAVQNFVLTLHWKE